MVNILKMRLNFIGFIWVRRSHFIFHKILHNLLKYLKINHVGLKRRYLVANRIWFGKA